MMPKRIDFAGWWKIKIDEHNQGEQLDWSVKNPNRLPGYLFYPRVGMKCFRNFFIMMG